MREALLAAVSHDLRGPLANIKAAATSLLSEDVEWPAEEVRSFCKTIDAEADRLHAVVTNLLDMGRLQAGMLGVRISEVPWTRWSTRRWRACRSTSRRSTSTCRTTYRW